MHDKYLFKTSNTELSTLNSKKQLTNQKATEPVKSSGFFLRMSEAEA